MGTIRRRAFLIGSAAIVGGVAFGTWQITKPYDNPLKDHLAPGETALTPYVLVNGDGITVIVPRAEMGQGVMTTLAALVAEELDVGLDAITVKHGPAGKAYYNSVILEEAAKVPATDDSAGGARMRSLTHIPAKLMGMQVTGGSTSTPDAYNRMRKAGAAARLVFIKAAARQLGVKERDLTTENGAVLGPDGMRIAYTELAEAARAIEPPANPPLKPRADWKLLGRSQPRLDMVGKCTGTTDFSIDVRLPGMVYAAVRMNPNREAPLNSFDAEPALAINGVKKVMALDNGIAVLARNSWAAFQGAKATRMEWAAAAYVSDSAAHLSQLRETMATDEPNSQMRDDGNAVRSLKKASADGTPIISGTYEVPYLAHATMEPMNAVAYRHDDILEIWAGNQAPTQARKDAATISGLSEDKILIHTTLMGGGFGRRAEMDFIKQAVKIAVAEAGTPIKLTWTREEDITQDYYRPAAVARFQATLADGKPDCISLDLAATSVADSQFGRLGISLPGADPTLAQNAWDQPYAVPNYLVSAYKAPMALPVSSWRSVGASQNGFFHECMMDEIAVAAGRDAIDMRLDLMDHEPSVAVLKTVRDMAGWGANTPTAGENGAKTAQGAAFFLSFGVPTAQIVEIEETSNGIALKKIWAAVDVGLALDPANIEAQVQSAIIYGLSAALGGEITMRDGKVEQSNFHDYDALRLYQCPEIEVAILENLDEITGIGEPGLPPVAPALANAVFALTGERVRKLPLAAAVRFI
ncbi:MAG: molybdopterin cofactor-binding domain-containing protein [Pseudomonadota bacterium]